MKRSFIVTIYENQNTCFKKEMKLKNQAYEKETQLWACLAKEWNKVLFGQEGRKTLWMKAGKIHLGLIRKGSKYQPKEFRLSANFWEKNIGGAHFTGPCQAPTPKFNHCLRQLAYTTWKQMILWEMSLWILFPWLGKLTYNLLPSAGYCWTTWNSAQTRYLSMK